MKQCKVNINGWKYIYDVTSDGFQVVPKHYDEIPDTLYKYYPLNDYSLDALLHCYLYASHPFNFNDYFDCCKDTIEYDDYNEISKIFNGDPMLQRIFTPDSINDKEKLKYLQELHWQFSYSKKGIVCFSPNKDSILMWSHYAQNNGFVVEFDYSMFSFDHYPIFPIQYAENQYISSLKKHPLEFAELLQTTQKNSCWSYEKEWRMIVRSSNYPLEVFGTRNCKQMGGYKREFNYPINAIKHVVLGYRFFLMEELQVIDDKTQKVLINPYKQDKRCAVLNFICTYGIPTQLATTNGLNKIGFINISIDQTTDFYIIKQIMA